MKRNKTMVMALSFCLGAVMLASTAFADIASKSGYEQLKDAAKLTAESLDKKLQSFTMEGTVTLKDNDKVLYTSSSTEKVNSAKGMSERSSSTESVDGEKQDSFSYSDKSSSIWYNSSSDTYYVTEFTKGNDYKAFRDPFQEERAKDAEKIFDAVVGNLKEYVVVEEKADGSKEFSGTLSEAQIPALVNAVSSFVFKQTFTDRNTRDAKSPIPAISSDVFVKKVKGKASVNKDGILENIFATGILSGKDKEGNSHDLTIEVLGKVVDINSTTVQKPDLKGKNVEKNISDGQKDGQNEITQKYVGKYKNDIVIEKDGRFVKVGERFIEISHIDGKNIAGRYYEQYKQEYTEYAKNKKDFRFDAEIKEFNNAEFDYTTPSGKKDRGNLNFDTVNGKIYFNIPSGERMYDSGFSRVFDE